ncbi:ATP-binding protein [Methylobacterium sp.]|uniref:ATP-binding protein n=1 Tax=Methylobacterium sp. TaxID=409 RepID=UPI003C77E966
MLEGRWHRVSQAENRRDPKPEAAPHVSCGAARSSFDQAGTGLGLSMVHGFVEQSGGSIAAESVIGQGTSITLSLPAADRSGSDRERKGG